MITSGLHLDWVYSAIMLLAMGTGFALHRWTREENDLTWWQRAAIGLGALCGGLLGAKLPFLFGDLPGLVDGSAWLSDGKTIVSGLIGGYLGVQVAEWALHLEVNMCDSFAAPVAAAVAIGRWGCYRAGCCYGVATSLPWGVDFGDGVARHPTQLYESSFHFLAAVVLLLMLRRNMLRGHHIRLYFLAYFLYRFATEFLRPEARLWLGLTGYQYATLFLVFVLVAWGLPCCPAGWRLARLRRRTLRRLPPSAEPVRLKMTRTVCPICLETVQGEVFQQHGRVLLRRECAEHGESTALLCSDRRHYYLRDEVPHPPLAEGQVCCGGAAHRSCIALLEMTDACNLKCPVCYAESPAGEHRPLADLCRDLEAFLDVRGPLDILQLSGGEPLLHPDLLAVIDFARTRPVDHIMLNTNGLELLSNDVLLGELKERCPTLEVSLQFDGLDRESYRVLRGADLLDQKRRIIERLAEARIPTTLVCTLSQGVNEGQVGPLVEYALTHDVIRGITIQPATWVGRFEPDQQPLHRLTLADVLRHLEQQTDGVLREADFEPLPCSDPNCCSFTYLARRRPHKLVPLTRLVRVKDHLDRLADRINFKSGDAEQCCELALRPEDVLRIVVKPFMDAHTYDQDRVDECCVHVIQPGGQAVSFCRFNTLLRGRAGAELVQIDLGDGSHPT